MVGGGGDKRDESDDRRGVVVRVSLVAALSVGVLFGGSQIARAVGQDVDWYAGFGQWLGALASFAAAGVALWISVTDRRRAEAARTREHEQQRADLAREAGLVHVTAEIFGRRQAVGPMLDAAGIGIRNRRRDQIFDIDIVRFVHRGREVPFDIATDVDFMNGWATSPVREKHEKRFPQSQELPGVVINSDEMLVIYQPSELPRIVADYVAIEYTDRDGYRWQVDTDGKVKRL